MNISPLTLLKETGDKIEQKFHSNNCPLKGKKNHKDTCRVKQLYSLINIFLKSPYDEGLSNKVYVNFPIYVYNIYIYTRTYTFNIPLNGWEKRKNHKRVVVAMAGGAG